MDTALTMLIAPAPQAAAPKADTAKNPKPDADGESFASTLAAEDASAAEAIDDAAPVRKEQEPAQEDAPSAEVATDDDTVVSENEAISEVVEAPVEIALAETDVLRKADSAVEVDTPTPIQTDNKVIAESADLEDVAVETVPATETVLAAQQIAPTKPVVKPAAAQKPAPVTAAKPAAPMTDTVGGAQAAKSGVSEATADEAGLAFDQGQDEQPAQQGKQAPVEVERAAKLAVAQQPALQTTQNIAAEQNQPIAAQPISGLDTASTQAKPTPEVTVQVPQQRAELAAKHVGLEISRQAAKNETSFTIRMDPPELGKLDVKLTLSKSAEVQASISIEREGTYELLARDLKALERALNEAGLKTDQNSLELNLKNQSFLAERDTAAGQGSGVDSDGQEGEDGLLEDAAMAAAMRPVQPGRPVDIII